MSKLSEEEIIEIVKKEIVNTYAERKAKALQGLLDLYNKQKEENRKLRNCHFKYEEMTGIDLLLEK